MPTNSTWSEADPRPNPVAVLAPARVAEALRVIAAAPAEDFDGHTEFHRLTPAQRLEWMEGALELIESRRCSR